MKLFLEVTQHCIDIVHILQTDWYRFILNGWRVRDGIDMRTMSIAIYDKFFITCIVILSVIFHHYSSILSQCFLQYIFTLFISLFYFIFLFYFLFCCLLLFSSYFLILLPQTPCWIFFFAFFGWNVVSCWTVCLCEQWFYFHYLCWIVHQFCSSRFQPNRIRNQL